MKIEKYAVPLSTGQTVECEYDSDGDLLEIYFVRNEATAAIELTDNMVLRFDWENCVPLSLSIISFSTLLQPSRYRSPEKFCPAPRGSPPLGLALEDVVQNFSGKLYGAMHFELLIKEWSEESQEKILAMLRKPPLTEFLTLSSYTPAHVNQVIPTTAVKQIPALVAA